MPIMTTPYKGMDAALLEAEYNLRARRGSDFEDLVERWLERSATQRNSPGANVDLAYGAGVREKLDWFSGSEPDGPALIFIHGGYWQRGDKSMYSFVTESFVEHGVSVAVINYNLTPSVRMPQIPPQIQKAVSWVWQNAPDLGFARDKLFISGHSAGGHLTALLALDSKWIEAEGVPAGTIRGLSLIHI